MDQGARNSRVGRLLLVDEQDVAARIIAAALTGAGHEVHVVGDGFAAGRELAARPFDLMILDLNLSRPNSSEFLRTIRSRRVLQRIAVLGLLQPGEAELAARSRHLGVEEFLEEPFDPAELLRKVDSLLARETTH